MGLIITVAQQKGGAGKTTLAAQIAVALLKSGAKVVTMDIDPQGSLSLWYAARMASLGSKNKLIHQQLQGWRLKKEAERWAKECDYVIIDSPPHTESEAQIAIRAADLLLIPIQPSPMDLWASRPTVKAAKDDKIKTLLVLNRVAQRAKLTASIVDKIKELDTPIAKSSLGNRTSYASSMVSGKGVVESDPNGPATSEILELVKEIKKFVNASESQKSKKSA
jgi:chromosome partitioning protein